MRTLHTTSTIKILIFSGIAITALLMIASGLPNLKLQPGDPSLLSQLLQHMGQKPTGDQAGTSMGGTLVILIFQAMVILTLISLPFALVYFFISSEFRKQFFKRMIPFVIILLALYVISRAKSFTPLQTLLSKKAPTEISPMDAGQHWKSFVEFSSDPSQWLTILSSFAFAFILIVLTVWIINVIRRNRQNQTSPLENLAGAAQNAIKTFQTGGNFKNTVIRCYVEMNQALEEQRGIHRQQTMTPREFEINLSKAGLPNEPIQQLTRMFEAVRYGTKTPSKDEEHQTMSSLAAIIEACKRSS